MNELVLKIMKIVFEKSHNDKNTMFIYFYGHVNILEINIYIDGWYENEDPDYKQSAHIDRKEELEKILEYLEELED